MKELKKHVAVMLVLFISIFVILSGYFVYSVYTNGANWRDSSNNPRLTSGHDDVIEGALTDRDGVVLAWSDAPLTRYYTDDANLRYSMAQLLGDNLGMTSGSMEEQASEYLYGETKSWIRRVTEVIDGGIVKGLDVMLSLDSEVQKTAYSALAGRNGCAVVINYKTGEIICSVSNPTYDVTTITREEANAAQNGTFLNKVVQGSYTPGSIFKTITAASLIENGYTELSYNCVGNNIITGSNASVSCYAGHSHGALDLTSAFAHSCNGAFAEWAYQDLTYSQLADTAKHFGFNDNFKFRDCMLYDSSFVTPEDGIEMSWAAVGQYKTMLSPLHAAMIAGAVANDGLMMSPKYIRATVDGEKVALANDEIYNRAIDGNTARVLQNLMQAAVENGTASGAAIEGYTVCGKTGTAEVDNEAPHAWFIGYIQDASAPYAIAVIFENGGTGASVSVPAANAILRACIAYAG